MLIDLRYIRSAVVGCLILSLIVAPNSLTCQENPKEHYLSPYERELFLYKSADSATTLVNQGETWKVLELCNNAFESLSPGIESRYCGYMLSYKGQVYKRIGNYFLAEKCYRLSNAYAIKFNDQELTGSTINSFGVIALLTFDYLKAKTVFNKLILENKEISDESLKTLAFINLAEIAVRENDTVAGEAYFSILTPLLKKPDTYLIERNLGRFLMKTNRLETALQHFKNALTKSLYVNGQNQYQTGLCYFHMGECYQQIGNRDSAESCYNNARKILLPDENEGSDHQVDLQPQYETVLIEFLIGQGEFYLDEPETCTKAFETFKIAIDRLLFLSHSLTSESTRFIIAEKGRTAFNHGITCALRLYEQTSKDHYLDQAFEWSLQSKSLSLNWLVEKDLTYALAGIPAELITRLQDYRNMLEGMLGDSISPVVTVPLDSVGRVIRLYERIEEQIRSNYEEIRKGMDSISLMEQIRKNLSRKEQYISFYDLGSSLVVFSFRNSRPFYFRIEKDSQLIAQINRFKSIVSGPPYGLYGSKDIAEFMNTGNDLYNKLLRPIMSMANKDHLALHPDGILLAFPFEALITEKSKAASFRELPYLFKDYQVRYVSTPLLARPDRGNRMPKSRILLISCESVPDIPAADKEVKGISDLFRSARVWNMDQTGQADQLLGEGPLLIHICSHLAVNEQDPLRSGISCRSGDPAGLTFRDILNYRLTGSQVYINTCESGNGPMNHGEGLMSLGLAFSIAGSSTIIQQMWKAPDQASGLIAQDYYRFLKGESPACALSRAKNRYLEESPAGADHPYYWAGVTCYSDQGENPRPLRIVLILILISVLVGIAYLSLRKRSLR